MNRMAKYDHVVFEQFEDGVYVVNDEGWLPEEWEAAKHVCAICERAFVTLLADGRLGGSGNQRYCSRECYTAGRRRLARGWATRKKRAA